MRGVVIKDFRIERLGKSRVNLGGMRRSLRRFEKRMNNCD